MNKSAGAPQLASTTRASERIQTANTTEYAQPNFFPQPRSGFVERMPNIDNNSMPDADDKNSHDFTSNNYSNNNNSSSSMQELQEIGLPPATAPSLRPTQPLHITASTASTSSMLQPNLSVENYMPWRGLMGKTYKTRDGSQYHLPEGSLCLNDGSVGLVDKWPNRRVAVNAKSYPLTDGKPEFLLKVEDFIETELGKLRKHFSGADGETLEKTRFQIYVQAFQHLIEEFQHYKPILSAIKQQYDKVFEKQDREVQQLTYLQAQLQAFKGIQHNKEKVIESRWKQREAQLLQELDKRAVELREQNEVICALRGDNLRQLEDAKAKEAKFDEQMRSNVTLTRLLKRYKYQLEEYAKKEFDIAHNVSTAQRDLEEMTKAHEQCLLDLGNYEVLVSKMLDENTARDLQENCMLAQEERQKAVFAYRSLATEHKEVMMENERLLEARVAMEEEVRNVEKLRRSATPRPDWPKFMPGLADHIAMEQRKLKEKALAEHAVNGGVGDPPQVEIYRQPSTEKLVGRLVQQLTIATSQNAALRQQAVGRGGGQEDEEDDGQAYFEGKGNNATLHKFLRTTGKVRNLKFTKSQTEDLVKNIWTVKYASATHQRLSLAEFVYVYLHHKYGLHVVVCEWGYNLMEGLKRYKYDADIGLFSTILEGALSEEVYADQMNMITNLQKDMRDLDLTKSGTLPRKVLLEFLKRFFPSKDDIRFQRMKRALYLDHGGKLVPYPMLFKEDEEGNQGEFCG